MNLRALARKAVIEVSSPFLNPKNGVFILNGHYLCRDQSSDLGGFRKQLKDLRRNYGFINFEEALRIIDQGEKAVADERLIAFTFDDGFIDCSSYIAPVLNEFGVNACFFINSDFVGSHDEFQKEFTINRVRTPDKKPMSWRDVKKLDENGFVIGNHTKGHFRLSELGRSDFYDQVMDSHNKIEHFLGKKCEFFAWPYGRLSDVTEEQVAELTNTYKYIFSSANYQEYFSFNGAVYNRRHFEPFWPASHVKYFLSKGKKFNK